MHAYKPTKVQVIKNYFEDLGITIENLAELVFEFQSKHIKELTMDDAITAVKSVLNKREVQHALITAIDLDSQAMSKELSQPLQVIAEEDRGTFGVDETGALGVLMLFGSIAFSNWGWLDIEKPGVIGKVNDLQKTYIKTNGEEGMITIFMDDQLSAIVAGAEAKLAHDFEPGHNEGSEENDKF